jgi:uncharacterized membrane protein YhaH (DUF805 family)
VTIVRWYVPRGRLSLAQFWMRYCVPFMAAAFAAYVLDGPLGWQGAQGQLGAIEAYFGGPMGLLVAAVTLIPTVAATVCRLQDRGHSADWLWWLAVPVLGWVILIADVWFGPGQPGSNVYGPPPDRAPVPATGPQEWVA